MRGKGVALQWKLADDNFGPVEARGIREAAAVIHQVLAIFAKKHFCTEKLNVEAGRYINIVKNTMLEESLARRAKRRRCFLAITKQLAADSDGYASDDYALLRPSVLTSESACCAARQLSSSEKNSQPSETDPNGIGSKQRSIVSSCPAAEKERRILQPSGHSDQQLTASVSNHLETEDEEDMGSTGTEKTLDDDNSAGLSQAYIETTVATDGVNFSFSYSIRDLHRDLLRGEQREPWYLREPPRLPRHSDRYYCKRGTVAQSRRARFVQIENEPCQNEGKQYHQHPASARHHEKDRRPFFCHIKQDVFKRNYLESYRVNQRRTKYDDEVIRRIMGPAAARPLPVQSKTEDKLVDLKEQLPVVGAQTKANTEKLLCEHLQDRDAVLHQQPQATANVLDGDDSDSLEQLLANELSWLPYPNSAVVSNIGEGGETGVEKQDRDNSLAEVGSSITEQGGQVTLSSSDPPENGSCRLDQDTSLLFDHTIPEDIFDENFVDRAFEAAVRFETTSDEHDIGNILSDIGPLPVQKHPSKSANTALGVKTPSARTAGTVISVLEETEAVVRNNGKRHQHTSETKMHYGKMAKMAAVNGPAGSENANPVPREQTCRNMPVLI